MACELEKKTLAQSHAKLDEAVATRSAADDALIAAEAEAERIIAAAVANVKAAQETVVMEVANVQAANDAYLRCVTGAGL